VAISDDAPAAEADRRTSDLAAAAAAAGAKLEQLEVAAWVARCAGLPAARVRLAGRDARVSLPQVDTPWAYDAGRRLALVADAAVAVQIAPHRPAPPPSPALVARVREALAP
jgi:hypothetical protein